MAGQVLLVADRSEAVIQQGQPPAQMAAWLLDIADGSNALATAAEFVEGRGFPDGTTARVFDLSANPIAMLTYKLTAQWVQQ